MASEANNNSMQKADARDIFDDIDDVDMIEDDDDDSILDSNGQRIPSKKKGNLDLTLNVKETKGSEDKEVSFNKNINNSTSSLLMSATSNNKKTN